MVIGCPHPGHANSQQVGTGGSTMDHFGFVAQEIVEMKIAKFCSISGALPRLLESFHTHGKNRATGKVGPQLL